MSEPVAEVPRLTVPAALLWLSEEGRGGILAAARRHSPPQPGVRWLRPELCAVVPAAGDPALFDAAVALARRLLRASGEAAALSALILPGRVRISGSETSLVPEPLLQDFARRPPSVPPGQIHLTSYVTARLEVRRRLAKGPFYNGPSGSRAPLLQLLGEEMEPLPWRNPELLRRRLPHIPRPALDSALANAGAAVRVTGALGSGKTRAVHRVVSRRGSSPLWLSCRPPRHGGPGLAAQLAARLLREATGVGQRLPGLSTLGEAGKLSSEDLLLPGGAPDALQDGERAVKLLVRWLKASRLRSGEIRTVVCDDLDGATDEDLDFAGHLAQAAGERRFRLVLVARAGTRWPASLESLPEVQVPSWGSDEMSSLAGHAFAGLSLPAAVEEKILAAAAGLPFALEEALAALVHHRLMRQVYGSFFFNGDDDTPCLPSDRLVQHTEAEAHRLGEGEALRRLALADTPLPPAVVAAAGGAPAGWEAPYLEAGLLRPAESPWGRGVELPFPALGHALTASLDGEETERLRQELGRVVAPRPATAWSRYRLLAGAPEATAALLEAVAGEGADSAELVAALSRELGRHRQRGGKPEIELELLWHLLPLARRLGRLSDFAGELARALELAQDDAKRFLALASLKAELDEVEGRLGDAEATIRQALKRWGIGKEPGAALLVVRLGRLLIRQDRHQEARELLEQVEPILKRAGASTLHASCLFYLGNVALHQERLEEALELHRRALAPRRKMDQPKNVGTSLSAIGRVSLRLGRYIDAHNAYQEAEAVFLGCGETGEASFALLGIGRVLARLGDHAGASAPLRRALALRERGNDVVGQAIARLAVAESYLHLEQPGAAMEEARRAYFTLQMLPDSPAALGDGEHLLGRILLLQRKADDAARHFATAAELHRKHKAREPLAFDLGRWIEAAILGGETDEVRRLTGELESLLSGSWQAEQREILELYLYRGLDWLEHAGDPPRRAKAHLRRAYRELLRRAEPLPRELRHRFLFQIPEHEATIHCATKEGLSWPDLPLGGDVLRP